MRVSLALDEYLKEFSIFNQSQNLLDLYYEKTGETELPIDYDTMVKETYPIVYDIITSMRMGASNLTWEEVWFIANATYSKKGVIKSLLTFCKYIDINSELIAYNKEGQDISGDVEDKVPDHYVVELKDVSTNSINLFLSATNKLIEDLLIWDNYAIRIDRLTVEYKTSFKIDVVWNIKLRYDQVTIPEIED